MTTPINALAALYPLLIKLRDRTTHDLAILGRATEIAAEALRGADGAGSPDSSDPDAWAVVNRAIYRGTPVGRGPTGRTAMGRDDRRDNE